ncbi:MULTISPECIES: hypothetical protein [unclassified Kitasatospora]|uniref:hypothetical protein n=1 Tax=unclassified Kitasatospora TaxID=2633591 RepID=UPI0033FEA7A6
MSNKKSRRQRDAARARADEVQRQRLGATEGFHEEHAGTVAERHLDPRFIQRRRTDEGHEISWHPDTKTGQGLQDSIQRQLDSFREKFGREPGPDDPLFFDPDADEPRPMPEERITEMLGEMAVIAERAGIDPAFIHAWRDLGYVVTEDTRHLFSAAEVQVFSDAVRAYQSESGSQPEEPQTDTPLESLRNVIDAIITRRDPRIAMRVVLGIDRAGATEGEEAAGLMASILFGALAGWLSGAREAELTPDDAIVAVDWVRESLGTAHSRKVMHIAGILGHPDASGATVNEAADQLGDDFLPTFIWLTAGVVATAGKGDVHWLNQFDISLGH